MADATVPLFLVKAGLVSELTSECPKVHHSMMWSEGEVPGAKLVTNPLPSRGAP